MSAEERKPLCDGFATWYVWDACPHTSKAGNESTKLSLLVKDEHGGSGFINEYLSDKTMWKLKLILASCGQESQAKKGMPSIEFFAKKTGTCRIKNRPGTPWFEVAEYIKPAPIAKEEQTPIPENFFTEAEDDDDIPF